MITKLILPAFILGVGFAIFGEPTNQPSLVLSEIQEIYKDKEVTGLNINVVKGFNKSIVEIRKYKGDIPVFVHGKLTFKLDCKVNEILQLVENPPRHLIYSNLSFQTFHINDETLHR